MSKKNYFLGILLAIATVFQGCKEEDDDPIKQEEPVVEEGCKQYDNGHCSFGAGYRPVGSFYFFPRFNPNNANEFLYVKDDFSGSRSIYKYNLLSRQNTLIAANVYPLHQPDWSRTGWIVFSDMNWKVWKVRDNGTGLQQLTFGSNDDQSPNFNLDGNKIIYRSLGKHNKMLLIDLDGNLVDSVCSLRFGNCYNWEISSWIEPNRILRITATGQGTDGELSFYNYATKQDEPPLFTIQQDSMGYQFFDYKALSQTKVLYTMTQKGLVEFDANTKNHRIIRPYCGNRTYFFFDISPDKTRILAEKETNTLVSDCLYDQSKSIVIMNIDGSNEQEISLP